MASLKGTKPQEHKIKIRDGQVEVSVKPMAYGKVMEIQQKAKSMQDEMTDDDIKMVENMVIEYTDLDADSFGTDEYCLTADEASDLFMEILQVNKKKDTGVAKK